MTRSTQILGLVGWLALCFVAAGLGAIASIDAKTFYSTLVRPSWAPPGWLFGPVWTLLYFMMAVAVWLVWRTPPSKARTTAIQLFLAQLVANMLWSWLFFAWRQSGWALVEVVVLWGLIACTLVACWRVKPMAGALLVPYLAWVSFATALNAALWRAN
jgi:translocator protein